jgi:hypothetical protein
VAAMVRRALSVLFLAGWLVASPADAQYLASQSYEIGLNGSQDATVVQALFKSLKNIVSGTFEGRLQLIDSGAPVPCRRYARGNVLLRIARLTALSPAAAPLLSVDVAMDDCVGATVFHQHFEVLLGSNSPSPESAPFLNCSQVLKAPALWE